MKTYTTTLEQLTHDVGSILDSKLSATSPQAVADYVSFGISNLEDNITKAKQAKKELDAYIKEQTNSIETVKEGTAKWLSDNGIDKLEGMRISSLTTYEPKPKETFKILDEDFFIGLGFTVNTVYKAKAKEWVEENISDYGVEVVQETHGHAFKLETTHKQPTIKVNKKRGA